MDKATYHIVFEGRLTGDLGLKDVKQQLAAMFKMNPSQVEALFSGKPVVIKRNVDEATAARFKAAFKKAGAVCQIVPAGGAQQRAAPPGPSARAPSQTTSSAAPPQAGATRATGRMAGKDIVNVKVPSDLGSLSMGQAGEDIPTAPGRAPAELPDTAGLSFSQDESYLEPEKNVPEPDVDISGLSVEKSE